MSNVIAFQRPKPRPAAAPRPAPRFNPDNRNEWVQAVKAAWANPANWRTSKKNNRYIVIEEIGVCVVINRTDEGYWSWEIRGATAGRRCRRTGPMSAKRARSTMR